MRVGWHRDRAFSAPPSLPQYCRTSSGWGSIPTAVRLLVVKSGYLSPELAPIANPNLMALTEGVVNQDIANLASNRRARPVFPFDRNFEFTPQARLSARWDALAVSPD